MMVNTQVGRSLQAFGHNSVAFIETKDSQENHKIVYVEKLAVTRESEPWQTLMINVGSLCDSYRS